MEQPPSTEKTGPQKGDVIDGKLEIDGIIAEGRTSTVASAFDRKRGVRVAVKIARGSDLESVERFRRAARGMARLTSPHVVKVLEVGTTQEGAPCMTMEYLEGRTLAQKVVQSGPLPIDEATKWTLQICDAVADAHAQKLLHRDLDVENVFLAMPPLGSTGQPSVRVLDFGLAPVWRLGKGDGRLRPGDVPGTSFAMAPELARGSDLDERVDVWGIGACLYRLLTNRHPYNARNLAELCTRLLAERPPDLTRMRNDVTPGLAAVVKRCLEREPADRFRSVRDVIEALEATRDEAPLTPQVKTERATLEQLRAIEEAQSRMTPMVFRAADRATDPGAPIPSSNDDDYEGATAMYNRADLGAPVTPPKATPAVDFAETMMGEPTGPLGLETPNTMRVAPSFEAIAARLEPPKPKYRTDPPPMKRPSGPLPPPMSPPMLAPPKMLEREPSDGPSTQPLGRLSPYAELPKAALVEPTPPSDGEHTIKPVLLGAPPTPRELPRPSPAMMAMETLPPPGGGSGLPPLPGGGSGLPPLPGGGSGLPPLPKPSPAMMAQETVQGPSPVLARAPVAADPPTGDTGITNIANVPPGPSSPLVFQAAPRTFEMSSQMQFEAAAPAAAAPAPTPSSPSVSGPPPPVMTGPPPMMSGPPPMMSGPPPMMSGPPPMMSGPPPVMSGPPPVMSAPPPPGEAMPASAQGVRKSRLIIPLLFALAIAVSIVIGLYVARATQPKDVAKPAPSSTPSADVSVAVAPAPPPAPSPAPAPAPASAAPVDSDTSPTLEIPPADGPSATPATTHHRRKRPPPPPPAASATPARSGNVYDPSAYDPK